jgi:hypothetical protein
MLLAVAGGANKVSRLASDMMILFDGGIQHCELNLSFSSKFSTYKKTDSNKNHQLDVNIYAPYLYHISEFSS